MTDEEKFIVHDEVDWEGFDYAMSHKTAFDEVQDPEFHRLRRAYLNAREALIKYAEIEE